MNAETLRSSILQKAMEGKLLPQLSEEVDVDQIGDTPDEIPFEIPNKWKWIQIKNLVTKASQKIPDKKFEYVDVSSIDSEHLVIANTKKIDAKEAPSRARKILFPGMVIYSTVRPYLLKTCVIGKEFRNRELIGSTAFASMTCKDSLLFNKYFLYCLSSPFFVSHVKGIQKGVAYPAVSEKDFFSSFVPIPPVGEQKRIVKKLEELLPLVEEYGRDQEQLEKINKDFPVQMEKSLLQEAISGKLVEQLDEEPEVEQVGEAPDETPFEIPEKWKWVLLGDIGVWKSGSTPSRSNPDYYRNGTVNWLKTGDLNDGVITKTEEKVTDVAVTESRLKINPPGSILIAMYGATIGKVGILDIPSATNQACCACVPEDFVDNKYLYYFLLSQRKRFISMGAGGAQPNISKNKIVNFPFPLPPIGEQQRIVAKLDKLMLEIQKLK